VRGIQAGNNPPPKKPRITTTALNTTIARDTAILDLIKVVNEVGKIPNNLNNITTCPPKHTAGPQSTKKPHKGEEGAAAEDGEEEEKANSLPEAENKETATQTELQEKT
jgi:hypothetical protein